MKNANLMKFSPAVLAINIRFRIKSIIFSRLKLFFWNMRLRLAGIITKTYSVTRNVLKTLLTKSILVREEARGWVLV